MDNIYAGSFTIEKLLSNLKRAFGGSALVLMIKNLNNYYFDWYETKNLRPA